MRAPPRPSPWTPRAASASRPLPPLPRRRSRSRARRAPSWTTPRGAGEARHASRVESGWRWARAFGGLREASGAKREAAAGGGGGSWPVGRRGLVEGDRERQGLRQRQRWNPESYLCLRLSCCGCQAGTGTRNTGAAAA